MSDKKDIFKCEKCDGFMTIRKGKFGVFWGCSNYLNEEKPCSFTKKYVRDDYKDFYKKEEVTKSDLMLQIEEKIARVSAEGNLYLRVADAAIS